MKHLGLGLCIGGIIACIIAFPGWYHDDTRDRVQHLNEEQAKMRVELQDARNRIDALERELDRLAPRRPIVQP